MEAQQVVEKILSDAQSQADEITRQAENNRSLAQAELDKKLEEYRTETARLAEAAGEDKKTKLLATARMDIAKANLTEKRRLLDDIFQQAAKQIMEMPDDQYRDLMTKLMLKAVETGDEEVIVGKTETRIDKSFILTANNRLSGSIEGKLRLSQTKADLTAGFILKRGKIRINVSIDVLIAKARQDLETELAKQLFN